MRAGHRMRIGRASKLIAAVGLALATMAVGCPAAGVRDFTVVGDRIVEPLDPAVPDAARGRQIVVGRESGNCLICHSLAASGERNMGDVAPPLDGVGGRLDSGQLRLRLVDQSRLNPETVMPPYYRIDGLVRVAPDLAGRPVLSAREIEDVVAYLATLR